MNHTQVENLFFPIDDFGVDKGKILGEGAWAEVCIAERLSDHKQFAAKIYKCVRKGSDQKMIMMAALAQQKLEHPAILKFHGISFCSFESSSIFEPTILLAYMPNGTLRNILEKEKNGLADAKWTPTKKYINLLGITHAMKYMLF